MGAGTEAEWGRFYGAGRPSSGRPNCPKEFDMEKKFRLLIGAAFAVAGLSITTVAEAAPHGVKVGELTCNVSSGWGFVFGSSKDLHCTFRPSGHPREHYTGSISKFGVDIGYTEGGVLVWGVFAPSSDIREGALQGDYGGATAGATVGLGLGANVLVGGLDKSIALQPLSIEGNKGLNVAAGIGAISLKSAP
jgi:hypothetical protein